MKKINIYFLVIFSTLVFLGCNKKHTNLVVKLNDFQIHLLDNRFEGPQITQKEDLPAKAFGLRVEFKFQVDKESDWEKEPDFKQTNIIDSIYILSSENFDDTHPAGTNLIDCFSVFKDYEFYDVKDYLTGYRIADIEENDGYTAYESIDLLLMKLPNQIQNHQFTIRIVTNKGEVFEQTTEPINLSI